MSERTLVLAFAKTWVLLWVVQSHYFPVSLNIDLSVGRHSQYYILWQVVRPLLRILSNSHFFVV